MASDWIDISVGITDGMVNWPGDPRVGVRRISDLSRGDVANVSAISFCVHTGTHVDAPLHFVDGAAPIDAMPLEAMIGPARVIEIHDPRFVMAWELESHALQPGERLLLKTRNSHRDWASEPFDEDFVHVTPEAAAYLAAKRVLLVGVDYLSVGSFRGGGDETHRILLAAGIWLIEGLNLAYASSGDCELICLPLKLIGAEGAPARALLRPR
jgi:arylformamidase